MGKKPKAEWPLKLVLKLITGAVGVAFAAYVGITRDLLPPGIGVHLAPTFWRLESIAWVEHNSGPLWVVSAFSYGDGLASFGRVMVFDASDGRELGRRHYRSAPKVLGTRVNIVWVWPFYDQDAYALILPELKVKYSLRGRAAELGRRKFGEVQHLALQPDGTLFVRTRGGPKLLLDASRGLLQELPRRTSDPRPSPRCYERAPTTQTLDGRLSSVREVCDALNGQRIEHEARHITLVGEPGRGDRSRSFVRATDAFARVAWSIPEHELVLGSDERQRHLAAAFIRGDRLFFVMESGDGRTNDLRDDLHLGALDVATGRPIWRNRIR